MTESSRVHTTSAPSAVSPDSPMATYTELCDAERRRFASGRTAWRSRLVLGPRRQAVAENRDDYVDRDGDVGGRRHVVDAQQIKTREEASAHRAGDVAAIEIAEPGTPRGDDST